MCINTSLVKAVFLLLFLLLVFINVISIIKNIIWNYESIFRYIWLLFWHFLSKKQMSLNQWINDPILLFSFSIVIIIYQSTFSVFKKITIILIFTNGYCSGENEILIQKLNLKEMNGDAMLAFRVSRGHLLSDPVTHRRRRKHIKVTNTSCVKLKWNIFNQMWIF